MLRHALYRLEEKNWLRPEEVEQALIADKQGHPSHTIGFELEVLPSAAKETPKCAEYKEKYWSEFRLCAEDLDPEIDDDEHNYAFAIEEDGVYEISSPPSFSPEALAIAVRGLVRSGWLPERAKGVVTAHVSVGTTESVEPGSTNERRMIRLLRCVELAGGSTPGRLYAPIKAARIPEGFREGDTEVSWNQKGFLGLKYGVDEGCSGSDLWIGEANRVELRTLRYQNVKQFGTTLETVYYLTGALLSSDSHIASAYDEFEEWYKGYCGENGLADLSELGCAPRKIARDLSLFTKYLKPYVDHFSSDKISGFQAKVAETVKDVKSLCDEVAVSNRSVVEF
jgi:hypothetical protein